MPIVSVPGFSSVRFLTAQGFEPGDETGVEAVCLAVPQAAATAQTARTGNDQISFRMRTTTVGRSRASYDTRTPAWAQ